LTPSFSKKTHTFGRAYKERPQFLHLTIGFIIVVSLYFLLYSTLDETALVSIMVFNLLFVFLTFPLRGPVWCKILWLGMGNIIGLMWNFVRAFLIALTVEAGGDLNVVTFVTGPAVDFLWMVPVWALGMSALAEAQRQKRKQEGK